MLWLRHECVLTWPTMVRSSQSRKSPSKGGESEVTYTGVIAL
jgi:hypothetical protein